MIPANTIVGLKQNGVEFFKLDVISYTDLPNERKVESSFMVIPIICSLEVKVQVIKKQA